MKTRILKSLLVAAMCVACVGGSLSAAEEGAAGGLAPAAAPTPAAAPVPAVAPASPAEPAGAPPALSALPGTEGTTSPTPGAALAVPTPPPLPSLGQVIGEEKPQTTETVATAAAAPQELYEFLYLKHDEYGPVRLKVSPQEAEKIREKEIRLLMRDFPSGPSQQPQQQQGDATRAFAEWDYYFEQLQLYSQYVKEVVLPEKKDDLDDPNFDVNNQDAAVQSRSELKTGYEKKAQELTNEQRDENSAFYERIQQREDRRKRYYEWIASQKRQLDEWAKVWARRANGTQWVTASGEVRRDDWYYGKNFNPGGPVATTIDGQTFVFSSEPAAGLQMDELNVLSTNLTPYDILDQNGVLKNPTTERQRGTLVEPPALPTPTPVPGIIQTLENQ
ncbi:MAG: hypothetical protein ACP5UB_09060 [Candidatus Sumerlaeaceae bacterium]